MYIFFEVFAVLDKITVIQASQEPQCYVEVGVFAENIYKVQRFGYDNVFS